MTNPQGPPNDPSKWARPGDHDLFGGPPRRPAEPQSVPAGPAAEGPTQAVELPQQTQPTEQIPAAAPSGAPAPQPGYPPPPSPPTRAPKPPAPADEEEPPAKRRRRFRDPLSILLVFIIVISLVIAGLIGAELYARHTADNKVAQVVACEVRDQATAKFGVAPLLLWQLATKHFTNISVETAGNQIRDAKGMKLQLTIKDVQLKDTADSQGTVGALDATVTWTADGIKQSVQNAIPVLGAFVTSSVITHPADGTIELKGMLNDIVAKPVVVGGGLQLQIVTFNTLGFSMPRESVQSTLNSFTDNLTKNFPLGIKAESVDVTSSGVVSHFSTHDASIPGGGGGQGDNQDPCFSVL